MAAARRIGKSQPGVSAALSRLRHALDDPLFTRPGRRLEATQFALDAVGGSHHVVMTMPVFSGVDNAVAESDLIARLPSQLAERTSKRLGLTICRPPLPVAIARLCIIWHRRGTHDPGHAWLRGQIAAILAPLSVTGLPLDTTTG